MSVNNPLDSLLVPPIAPSTEIGSVPAEGSGNRLDDLVASHTQQSITGDSIEHILLGIAKDSAPKTAEERETIRLRIEAIRLLRSVQKMDGGSL